MKFSTLSIATAVVALTTLPSPSHAFVIVGPHHASRQLLSFSSSSSSSSRLLASVDSTSTTNNNQLDNQEWANPDRYMPDHPNCNVPPHIANLVGRGLHLKDDHPIGIIRQKIEEYFVNLPNGNQYQLFDAEDPIVTTTQCFDDLRLPPDHPGRSPSDTYYLTDTTLLRTHTSAHQSQHLREGHTHFLCTGDVYRRDEIDASHYPAFHQLEGVQLFDDDKVVAAAKGLSHEEWIGSDACQVVANDLKQTLEGLMDHLFGDAISEKRWNDDYFPFTDPSFELEIMWNGDWLEVLGCGVVHTEVLENCDRTDARGWAFGLGLERLAMILFEIPDIRLFWTNDERFHSQFEAGQITKFEPYSKYPPCLKDIAFWLPTDGSWQENDFFELTRGIAGDLVESMECIDEFTNGKTGKTSKCYRITYRSMDRSLTNDEIDAMQDELRDMAGTKLGVEVR